MDLFTREDLKSLLEPRPGPCVSLYQPTHRGGSEADPIVFRKLLSAAQDDLVRQGKRTAEARDFLERLHQLLDDPVFWRNQCDGLAVFLAPGFFRLYRLPHRFAEEHRVADEFLISPLLPLLHGDGRYYVLALSQNSVRLYQGTRFTLSPIDLKGVPRNLREALRTHDRDEVLTYHTRPTSSGSWAAIFEGHGVGIDDEKDDLLLYFQRTDRGLHAVLREEKAPLVLAAVDYLQPIYRQANTYPHLLHHGVEGNPDRWNGKELHQKSWQLVEPYFRESIRQAAALFRQALGSGLASEDPYEVIPAVFRGQVQTLFVQEKHHVWGTFDPETEKVSLHESPQTGDEDLSNAAAIETLRRGHTVYALAPEEMPSRSPLAALYHLPMVKHPGKRP